MSIGSKSDAQADLTAALNLHSDKMAVADLIHRRARGADRFDVALMRNCHRADARESHGKFDGLAPQFIDNLVKADPGTHCLGKSHNVSNIIAVPRGNRMFVESYHVVRETFAVEGEVEERRVAYRYLDLCAREDDQWRFASRETVNEWAWRTRRPVRAHEGLPLPGMLQGTRLADDPLYRLHPDARGAVAAKMYDVTIPNGEANETALRRLLDKQAIAETCLYVARALDRDDHLLAEACVVDRQILAALMENAPGPDDMTFHFVTNIAVDFADEDRASVRSDFVRWSAPTNPVGERLHKISNGRYRDRFRRSKGRWLIERRDVLYDWQGTESGKADYWASHASKAGRLGVRGAADPLYDYLTRGARAI